MRDALLLLLIAIGVGAYLQRGQLLGLLQQGKQAAGGAQPTEVYQWRDAQGKVHFGDAADAKAAGASNARRMPLQPANTIPGMSQAQIDAALKPKAREPAAQEANCEADDAACMRRNLAPRNLAIENMETAAHGKAK